MDRNPLARPSAGMAAVVLPDNPFREGLDLRRVAEPSTMVVFGVTGDLSRRKLLPSLYVMQQQGVLPAGFSLVGFGRRPWRDEEFRTYVRDTLAESLGHSPESDTWSGFEQALFFAPGEFDDPGAYEGLGSVLGLIDGRRARTGNHLFYLAAPPNSYPSIIDGLGQAGLGGRDRREPSAGDGSGHGWARVVVEKPFGRDLATATDLNRQLKEWFEEDQIFRVDHYLGKETVQNILVFRLANGIFEPVWDRRSIDHVQITVAEDLGVGSRGPYFEQTGEMRDMVQNHVLQLLALVAMEPPPSLDSDAVRDERAKALQALRPLEGAEVDVGVVRGQYVAGFIAGEAVQGYRDEPGVSADSPIETFVALRVLIDNWRWAGVPFYLRAGKRLPRQATEIAIQFKQPPVLLFGKDSAQVPEPNVLAMHIQPDEGITLKVGSKLPGPTMDVHSVHMDFRYGSSFGRRSPEAYERLLLDGLLGDSTLFSREDTVDAAWRFVDRIRERWEEAEGASLHPYEAGNWGPREALELVARDGRKWRRP